MNSNSWLSIIMLLIKFIYFMRQNYLSWGISFLAMLFLPLLSTAQLQVGQVDSFDNGATQGWQRGSNVSGALQLTADGAGNSGKLVTFNTTQWAGNYLAAGVTAIQMTLENPSNQTLNVRLAFGTNNAPRRGETWFSSTLAATLAPNSAAQTFTFPISASDLTRVQGDATYEEVFATVQTLRIVNGPEPTSQGVNVAATLLVDNITAVGATTVETTTYKAILTGRNEPAPVATLAFGEVTATLTDTTLVVAGSFSGLSSPFAADVAGGAHIHLGLAGQNGGIQLPLTTILNADQTAGTFEAAQNTFQLNALQLAALKDRKLYVNIHSQSNRSGEIRGQILPDADVYYASNLFGSYEVPVVMTAASGGAAIEIRGNEMVLTGSFAGLEGDFAAQVGGGAHIHLAMAGQNGAVIIPIKASVADGLRSGTFEAADNTFTLTEEQLTALQGRRLYINIHTQKSLPGEIRGQIISARARTVFRAHLSGSYEVPIVTTTASGMVLAEVMGDGNVQFSGTFNGLESDFAADVAGGAHIHRGMAGMTGSIIVPFTANTSDNRTGTFPAMSNMANLPAEEITRLFNRGIYVNIHSQNNRSGELRGQLLPEAAINFNSFISSIFEVPEFASRALGAVKAELQGTKLVVSGSFAGLGSTLGTDIRGGAHIHLGFAGQTGAIQFELATTLNDDAKSGRFEAARNTFTLTPEQVAQLRARQLYVNIHSQQIRSGELRGQLLLEANSYFVAPLSGASETMPVKTAASGMLVVEVNGSNGVATGAFAGFSSDVAADIRGGAHLHINMAGANGPIRVELLPTINSDNRGAIFTAAQNTFAISTGLLDTIRNRMVYANIHSANFRSGEIRGQLLPLATAYFTTNLKGDNEVPLLATAANGALKLELTGNKLTVTGRFGGLQGAFDPLVAGGSHIHLEQVGKNGGIQLRLNATLDENLLGGTYQATNNVYELTDELLDALFAGNLYANIHTAFSRSGEIRGQILPEINRFPAGTLAITAPADSAAITIEGAENTPFVPTWEAATDRDKLAYIWQLSANADFSNILFQTTVEGTALETDFATVDGLLEAAGVEVGQTVTLYHRAIATDGALQSVGAGASVVLTRGVVGNTSEGVDLQLSIKASSDTYRIFTTTTFEVVVTNTGTQPATNIRIAAGRPTGLVHTSAVVTNGLYRVVIGKWDIANLEAGESDTLLLTLFALVDDMDITNFVQVESLDQADTDSTSGNNTTTTPTEDDEAVVTISPAMHTHGLAINTTSINGIYPSPATDAITATIQSMTASNTTLNIFNANGQLVQTQRIQLEAGYNDTYLNIHHLANGTYFLHVAGTETVMVFVKE